MSSNTRTGGHLVGFRSANEGGDERHYFTARVVNYNVPDSFNTSWAPGVFTRSLDRKLPSVAYGHNWERVIGKVVSYEEKPDGLDVEVRMSNFKNNPDAARMYDHLMDGEISEFSFAFKLQTAKREADPTHKGVERFTEADLTEVSPVLVGSVPGTHTLSVRSDAQMSRTAAADLLVKFAAGDIDLADALLVLKTEGVEPGENPTEFNTPMPEEPAPVVEPAEEPQPDVEEEAVLAKLDSLSRK